MLMTSVVLRRFWLIKSPVYNVKKKKILIATVNLFICSDLLHIFFD